MCGVSARQPTSAHQESCPALLAGSAFGPEGGTRSTSEFSGAKSFKLFTTSFCVYSPVASGADSLSTADESLGGAGEMSGSDWVSRAGDGVMARSRGALGRPRKGMLREKRLADGFKEDKL